jgi:hypothetical protein
VLVTERGNAAGGIVAVIRRGAAGVVDTLQQAVAVVAVAVFPFDVDDGCDAVAAVGKSVTNSATVNAI